MILTIRNHKGKKTVVIDKQSNKPYGKLTSNRTGGFKQSQGFKKEHQLKIIFFLKHNQ